MKNISKYLISAIKYKNIAIISYPFATLFQPGCGFCTNYRVIDCPDKFNIIIESPANRYFLSAFLPEGGCDCDVYMQLLNVRASIIRHYFADHERMFDDEQDDSRLFIISMDKNNPGLSLGIRCNDEDHGASDHGSIIFFDDFYSFAKVIYTKYGIDNIEILSENSCNYDLSHYRHLLIKSCDNGEFSTSFIDKRHIHDLYFTLQDHNYKHSEYLNDLFFERLIKAKIFSPH